MNPRSNQLVMKNLRSCLVETEPNVQRRAALGRVRRRACPGAFQNPEDNRFTPGPVPFLPTNTRRAPIGFIDFNLAGEGR